MFDRFFLSSSLAGDLVFRGSLRPWLALLLSGLALIAVFVVYFRESLRMNIVQRIVMALLRGLAIAAIFLLLCKPVLVSQDSATKPLPIAVMIDDTQSMRQRDPRTATTDVINAGIAWNVLAPDQNESIDQENIAHIREQLINLRKKSMNYEALTPAEYDKVRQNVENPTRADVVTAVFQNPRLNLRDELRKKGPLQEYFFGSQLHGAPADWVKNIAANESKTALLYSIQQLTKRDDNERPAAVVIATDGLDNDREHRVHWDDIARECKRLNVPLHIYGVGGGLTRLMQLRSLETNPRETLIAESSVSVTFRWTCRGVELGQIELNVKLGSRTVATKRLDVKEGDEIVEVLSFVPKNEDISPGKVDLEGSIRIVDGPSNEQDKLSFPVRVEKCKVKVLYIEDSPRWEFKFLMRALQREKIVEPSFVLVNGDDKSVKAGPPFLPAFPKDRKELFEYDMLIIGDVDPKIFSQQQRQWIAEFVEDSGGGLVMIAGRKHNPAGYLDTPIGKILPVEFEAKSFPIDDTVKPIEYRPQLSDVGRHDTVMSLADIPQENLKIWSELPGWFWNYPITKLKPAAQSLLNHPRETIADSSPLAIGKKQPMPLIAQHYDGRGIVMFVGSDETWRWRFNAGDKYFARFWGQVVYQVGLPHVLGSRSQLIPEGDFIRGKPTKIYARLFASDHAPLAEPRIEALLQKSDADVALDAEDKIVFEPVRGQPGLYVATIAKERAGDYNLKLPLPLSSTENVTLPIRVIVPPEDEQSPANLNEKALKSLAEQTGGKFYRESELKDLVSNIKGRTVNLNPPPRQETLLWTQWWVLGSIVGMLTLEWLIRKFSNLS